MAKFHVPDLATIDASSNSEIKFYAILGAVVGLSAAIEISFLDIFTKGLNEPRNLAAQKLYKARVIGRRRKMACAAMVRRLGSDPLLPEWQSLQARIKTITGEGALRHLIAHNVISVEGTPTGLLLALTREEFFVHQDSEQVLAGVRKPGTANYGSLKVECEEIIALLEDIDSFLDKIP
jgi:hypothetical protein